ncbi:uncharacterized protein LOC142541844 [Primulina tabacum]|uniref:uncharacterized protein LOC142541844 n=1 Tax=Primulina tabacum TaxID=48773 RepID=UPI003F59195C
MIDAASGGALVNKTPQEARALISNMAVNAQQFGTRQDNPPRQVSEVSANHIDQKLDSLTSLLEKLVVGQVQQVKTCSICAMVGHSTDTCPTLQEDPTQQVNAIGGFLGQPQHRYDPYSNSYNPGWKDYPNFSYRNQGDQQGYPQQIFHKHPSSAQASNSVVNPMENVSAITLRNCKELEVQEIGRNKLKGYDREKVGEHVSVVIQKTIPIKCSDPGIFSIPCTIGDTRLEKAMLDLGASINVMSDSVYKYLELGPLTATDIVIQLADRSTVYPRGIIEDVLVKVENLVFPADFYVLDMENDDLNSQILLGRRFLKTSKSVINVITDTLTMEFDENSKFVDKNDLDEIIERHVENSNIRFSLSDSQISKIERRLLPDRPKHVLMKKGGNIHGIEISKKFKKNMHMLKFAMKILKWNKVDLVTIYESP